MENKKFTYLYPYSCIEAKRLGEISLWQESFKANTAYKNAIEEAIRRDFDGMSLKKDCAESVIQSFGFHRVAFVLAASLQYLDYDGRFSRSNKEWAGQTFFTPDKDRFDENLSAAYIVNSHPVVLDTFVNQYRRAYQSLGLFDATHCLPDTQSQDFEDKVIVLSPKILKESHLTPQNQLWLCTGGFGARADSRGRAIFAICLADSEKTRWNRPDFIGVLEDAYLPDWAREKLAQFHHQTETTTLEIGKMHML